MGTKNHLFLNEVFLINYLSCCPGHLETTAFINMPLFVNNGFCTYAAGDSRAAKDKTLVWKINTTSNNNDKASYVLGTSLTEKVIIRRTELIISIPFEKYSLQRTSV